jgi:FtsP/CotA-like multicopper oxidase with cupredoxin domain
MDTPLVNGKAYPVLHVAPEAYRFQILSAGNDRSWNLQWYVADPTVVTPDGRTNTEVKMVPAIQPAAGSLVPLCTTITPITNTSLCIGLATAVLDASGNPINGTGLPAGCWPNFGSASQAAGIPIQQTMWAADGRAGGAPDPTTAGPPFIQIGTEGGLLPAPVVIPSMPTGYEANPRSVTITNVSVHGLWLGTAERADAIVDFTKFGGKTLILYNDAPTPAPAGDSRIDYFTGDGDQTIIGGAPNTLPGFGPNTRTIMQVVVDQAPTGKPFSLPALTAALPGLFAQTQPVPVVPEPTYPPASGGYSATPTYSLITDATLSFFPVGSTTPVTYTDERKTIQELFTLDYGRMNATLGVELPLTNFLTQTTIPLGYIDPVTEVINQGETQLWHITHNGVDTHFIHFHLFNVQVINRSAWDGTKRPPDQNELGWKDTVRMNPLEDILVALKPIQPLPPFPVRDSYRLMDVTMPAGPGSNCPDPAALNVGSPTPAPCSIFTNRDPITNTPTQTDNGVQNYGWEYVWHCHILGHEENDMMRAIAFNVPPEAPSNLTVAAAASGLNLSWTDNSASETGFTLERADDSGFTKNVVDTKVAPITGSTDANKQGITWGGTQTYNDLTATAGPYFYRVQAFKPEASYWTSGVITSPWSNTTTNQVGFATLSPLVLSFGTVNLGTPSALPLTLSNTSATLPLTFSILIIGPNAADFTQLNTCAGNLAAITSCPITVTFTPTVGGAESATLTITTSDPANPSFTVLLNGTGGALPLLTITANNTTMRYGAAVPTLTFGYSPANPLGPLTAPTCTTTATKTSPVGMYPITCTGAVDLNYAITYVAGTVSVTPAPLTIWASNGAMIYGGVPPVITPRYVGLVAGDTPATFSVLPNVAPTCTTTPGLTGTTPIGTYPSTCTGALDPNYTISYAAGKVTVAKAALTITSNVTRTYGTANPSPLPLTITGLVNGDTLATLGVVATCTTTATTASPVGTYPITCTGPASTTNYNITYPAGTLTVTPATLTVTANNATKVYGAALPTFTANITGFVNGDPATVVSGSPSLTTIATATSPVGSYTITAAQGSLAAANYTFVFVNGTLTVTPATLTVTANNLSKAYGGPLPALSITAVGLVAPDTLASIGITCSTTATAASGVGTYPIICSGIPVNYTVSYTPGTLTVTPVTLRITANPATRPFGTANPTFTVSYATFVNGDSPASLGGALTCTTTATITSVPGTYPITCGGQTSTNYTITYVPGLLTVTATVPLLSLAPTALTFSSAINVTTPSQAVTVRNIGGAALRINSIGLGGANPGRFGLTHNCPIGGTGLAAGGSCTVNVTFRPNNNTNRSALVNVNVAAPATSGTVTLTGTTLLPAVTASPTSLAFGNVSINTTSQPQTVTLQNTGTVPLVISSITLGGLNPGRFAQTHTCTIGGTGLAPGGSCTITVTFTPNRRVVRSATLNIRDNASPTLQTVTLTGAGI